MIYYSPTLQLDVTKEAENINAILLYEATLIVRAAQVDPDADTPGTPRVTPYIFGCSQGWNQGILRFSVKCIEPQNDVLGVVSNIKVCTEDNWISSYWLDATAYGLYGDGIIMENVERGQPPNILQDRLTKWKKNDIVTVKVDCEKWEISFWITNGLVSDQRNGTGRDGMERQVGQTIRVRPFMTYYPFIGSHYSNAKYQALGMAYHAESLFKSSASILQTKSAHR